MPILLDRQYRLGLVLVPERVGGVGPFECEDAELPHQLPVRFGHEALDLFVPVHQQLERGALDPPHGHEVLPYLTRGERNQPCEDGAPCEVDDLPGLSGIGKLLVGVGQVAESVLDLALGQGAELGPADDAHVGARLADGLHPDELSLPVVVGGDDYLVSLRREVLDHVEDGLHPNGLDLGGVHQIHGGCAAPVVVLLRVVQFDDVSPEAHDVVVVAS